MKFYSTNNKHLRAGLQEAVMNGLAPDKGLYMPERIPRLPKDFLETIENQTFEEIAFAVARGFLQDDVPDEELLSIIGHTIQFEAPVVKLDERVFAMELFHGPTMAFKDFGARFMSRLLGFFARQQDREVVILVATSGDTGSAVANGFLGVPGTKVIVLYPAGKVSEIQEKQFTTLGQNIDALEVGGTFDDCQRLVKQAFSDGGIRSRLLLTSANSINIARLIPQSFYYLQAYARVKSAGGPFVISVPSGNFGNLTGGILAQRMGMPVRHFIACTNINDVVPEYLGTGLFTPRPSVQTISNAMDVGDPSNFARLLDLYDNDRFAMANSIRGYAFTDDMTMAAMKKVYDRTKYVLDPHGAVGYLGLKKYMAEDPDVTGIFLETAHPGKFSEVVEKALGAPIELPGPLAAFLSKKKQSVPMSARFQDFKKYLLASS